LFFRACDDGVDDIAEIHLSSRARCASTPALVVVCAAVIGGNDIPEGLTGERVSDAPPDVVDVAGLSTRRNGGLPSLPVLLLLADESSLTCGRTGLGRTSSKSVSFTCTVSPSCSPSSSRNDFARSADKEIFERSEPLLPNGALGADADAGVRESPWPDGSMSVEGLRGSEPADSCRENGASLPRAVRVDSTWLSLLEICIEGGAPFSAAFEDGCATRLDAGASGFTEDCGSASRSCAGLGGPARRDGSLFMGVSIRRRFGDVWDGTGWAGDGETVALKGGVLGPAVV
jgi:hypothetical protein